ASMMGDDRKRIEGLLALVRQRKSRLLNLCLDKVITEIDYRTRQADLAAEEQRLKETLVRASTPGPEIALLHSALSFANLAEFAFRNGDKQKRRDIVASACLHLALHDKKLLILPKKLFAVFNKMATFPTWWAG
ncbi:MAG: hypothetical protein V1902_01955, partial [Candidatus Falkowbacteria bacterium]